MINATIQKIHSDFIFEAKNSPALLADMAAMEKYLSESYSGRIIVELLQNADDACSSKVFITERDGNVIFANNGRPFNDADVMAISRSGASEKKRGVAIGYRGIGFKSTSFLSSEIIIYSNDTAFCFSKSKTAAALNLDIKYVPTIRIPFLVDVTPFTNIISKLKEEGYTTIFIFKSSNKDVMYEEISSLSSDLMLFLKHLKEIETFGIGEDKLLRVSRKEKKWGQEVSIDKNKWGIIDNCIAFKMENDVFVKCDANDAVYYTFLPTFDKTPFPIKLNGDFSTDPSRKHIRLDEITQATLNRLAVAVSSVIEKAFTSPNPIYTNLLSIITDSSSFSNINNDFKSKLKEALCKGRFLKLNDGTIGCLSDYRCFPADFEDSVAGMLRIKAKKIWEKSLHPKVYACLNGVEAFLSEYTDAVYSPKDIATILEDKDLVKTMPEYVYSYLLGKTIQAYNHSKLFSCKDINVTKILIKDKTDKVIPLAESNMDSSEIAKLLQVNDNNQLMSNVGLKSFTEELGLTYVMQDSFKSTVSDEALTEPKELFQIFNPKPVFKASMPVIPRWRSAENACVEIEKFLGNIARDVSLQNLGYDVDSTTPAGSKRYIEVKSVSKIDSSFTLTNNEYTAAHQYGDAYFICLLRHGDDKSKAIYIQNPLGKLKFEKRIRQWEWYCNEYQGEEIEIEY